MNTSTNEGRGLIKTYWEHVRERVFKVEPVFAKLVDKLSPDKSYPVYLAYYPYGALTGDTESPFIPKQEGGFYRLSDPSAPNDVIKNLGYGKNHSPMGMVLDKNIEWFIDLKDSKISIPWLIHTPGKIFSFARNLSRMSDRIYAPNGMLTTTSGARSVFMLPNIGCITNHANLQREFNVQSHPPKSLYEHWLVFKEILSCEIIDSAWCSCLLFFSEKWVEKLHIDKAWSNLKLYLHELAWNNFEYLRNHIYYDIAFSIIQQKRNLKPNPYLADTARHLFTTALGAAPGYAPAVNEDFLPLNLLQKIYIESYGLKKYLPTIIQPTVFSFENDKFPIYYSLQNPSMHVFSPKSRKISSTLFEMRELEYIMRVFLDELSKDNALCSDTVIHRIAKGIGLKYFHNKNDRHRVISLSKEISELDERFFYVNPSVNSEKLDFACDAPFLRGCIRIMAKK